MASNKITLRVENALHRHLKGRDQPPRLGQAINHALFPGGARVRPSFALGVALACGDDRPAVSDALAAAVEFLHCASLVHDDLPCFDNAEMRRGKLSVHCAFDEPIALLAGDALIVMAFQALSDVAADTGDRLPTLLSAICQSAGTPHGLVAGQAMEGEPQTVLGAYHAAKTGALFEAAAVGGAAAAGGDIAVWRRVGARLGTAYQIADDIHDCVGNAADATNHGKPIGQDALHGRPNAVAMHGIAGAVSLLKSTLAEAVTLVPDGDGAEALRGLIDRQAARFLPKSLVSVAA